MEEDGDQDEEGEDEDLDAEGYLETTYDDEEIEGDDY